MNPELNQYKMVAEAGGVELPAARFQATAEDLQRILTIMNLTRWPDSVQVNLMDDAVVLGPLDTTEFDYPKPTYEGLVKGPFVSEEARHDA